MPKLNLEDFGADTPSPLKPEKNTSIEDRTVDQFATYDEGYKAGWEDAQTAATDNHTRIGAEFERNLQELSFTFHEAKIQVAQSLTPLVSAFIQCLFPKLMVTSLADQLMAVLEPLRDEMDTPTLELRCAPEDVDILGSLLEANFGLPITLRPEPSLMTGQADFVLGHETHEVDVSALQTEIQRLVGAQFDALTAQKTQEDMTNVG